MPRKQYLDFAAVRDAITFSDVLSHYNIDHPEGRTQIKINCPFHTDQTPSCSINLTGKFKCFGCDAKGNHIDFIILKEGGDVGSDTDRYRAHEIALEIIGQDKNNFGRGAPKAKSKATPAEEKGSVEPSKSEPEPDQLPAQNPVFDRVLQLEHNHSFLMDRNIGAETAEKFGMGFCPKGIMKDRIAIPIHNAAGECVGYVGRWAEDEVPEDTLRYKFPKGFQKSLELWNLHRALTLNKRFLTLAEGYWSAVRLHEMGIPCAALMGTSLSETQAKLIRSCGIRHAIQLLDGDEAGRTASEANSFILSQHVYTRTILLPEGEKPDSVPASFLEQFT